MINDSSPKAYIFKVTTMKKLLLNINNKHLKTENKKKTKANSFICALSKGFTQSNTK